MAQNRKGDSFEKFYENIAKHLIFHVEKKFQKTCWNKIIEKLEKVVLFKVCLGKKIGNKSRLLLL